MASKIELTKTLINALLNENRKSSVTPSQLATLYQHLLGIIEANDPYTKEETDALISAAKSAVLKTLKLQWLNTGNSIGLFTATNEELTRVSDVARQTSLDALRAILSQPREFLINDTADKFDATADSYFTEDIDGETIQFIDEEFTAVGTDALTLPVSICQGGKTIATFPAAFTCRLFDENDPDGWHAYEGHAMFESAGSVWKFLYNAIPGNNEQSLELVKISTKADTPEVLEIFLSPKSGTDRPYRFWKGKHDRKFIYDNQSIINVNNIFSYKKVNEKRVMLDLKCLDSSGNKISVFRGEVLFSGNDYSIFSEDFHVVREGIPYRVRLYLGSDSSGKKYGHIYFISSVFRQHDPTAPLSVRTGICPASPHEGYFYRNTGEIKLGLNKCDYDYYTKNGRLRKTWNLSHFGNVTGVFDACSKGLITAGLELGADHVGIKVRIWSDQENHWASSDDVDFEWDSETKKLTMNLHDPDVSRISIRVRFAAVGVPGHCPYIGRQYESKHVVATPSGYNIPIIDDSFPAFPTKNLRLFRNNSGPVIKELQEYLSQFHSDFQIQRFTRSKQKTHKDPTFIYKSKKWTNVRNECQANKGVFRIRYYSKKNKKSGPWQYFRICSTTNMPVRLL